MNYLIVTPTFNSCEFIRESFQSVISQLSDDYHVTYVIKDGCSSDNTVGIIRILASESLLFDNKNITFMILSCADSGMYDAINQAIKAITLDNDIKKSFDVFLWLNSDDRLEKDFLQNFNKSQLLPKQKWFIGKAIDIDKVGNVITNNEHQEIDYHKIENGDFNYRGASWIRAESVVIGFDLIESIGFFDPDLKLAGDYDLFVRLAKKIPPIYLKYGVKEFRLHDNQKSKDLIAYEYERFSKFRKFNPQITNYKTDIKVENIIAYYPDYTSGNPYQKMMYSGLQSIGFENFEKFENFFLNSENYKKLSIVHIHWLNDIVRRHRDIAVTIANKFKEIIKNCISNGIRIIATIHNIASHESSNIDIERELILFLFQVSTKVHVHHSIVSSELLNEYGVLPWDKIVIGEHGPFSNNTGSYELSDLLLQFGMVEGENYIVIPGQIRRYKNFNIIKFLIEYCERNSSDIKIVLAGQFHPELNKSEKQIFNKNIVRKSINRLNDEQYNLLIQNCFFVFLSYSNISTSGSFFHAISNNTIVMSPKLGTIPAYIDNFKNGIIYNESNLSELLDYMNNLNQNDISFYKKNIAQLYARLNWGNLRDSLFNFQN